MSGKEQKTERKRTTYNNCKNEGSVDESKKQSTTLLNIDDKDATNNILESQIEGKSQINVNN